MSPPITGSKLAITAAAMSGALMAVLDISIVNVALPELRARFAAPLDQISWVSTGYMMANVVVIPLTGWLQARFGMRRYFAGSLLLFTLASALCACAFDLPSLVAFRVLQGLGGGAIIPTAQTLLLSRYPEEEHGLAGALFGLGAITGPLLGPSAGGYLIDVSSWRWIFLVNVPFGLCAALLSLRHIEEPGHRPDRRPPDRVGIALLAGGLASLQYFLEEGNRQGFWESRRILACALVAGVLLCTFVVHELETPSPVVDLRLFRRLDYAAASAINFLLGVAAFSAAYLFSLSLGVTRGYAARDIGRVFLYGGVIQLVLMPLCGTLAGRSRAAARGLIALGIVFTCLALQRHAALPPQAGFVDLVLPRLCLSTGLSLLYVPLTVLALSGLPPGSRGPAAGLFNLTRELGGSVGTACLTLLLTRRLALHLSRISEGIGDLSQGVALLRLRCEGQALVLAFGDAFLAAAAGFALALPLVLLLWSGRRPPA